MAREELSGSRLPAEEIVALRQEADALRGDLDDALARQAATAEVLRVISAYSGDLTRIFGVILENAL